MLVEEGLAGVVAGEVVLGGRAELDPQRDQAGHADDPGDQGDPAVPVAGAPHGAENAGAGRRRVSSASDVSSDGRPGSAPILPAATCTVVPHRDAVAAAADAARSTPQGVAFAFVADNVTEPMEDAVASTLASSAENVLREDYPLPVCVLRAAVLERNLDRFQRYCDEAGVLLCPHAKTAMSPELFGRQLAAGAWGLTFATGPQVRVAREHGVPRIFYANQLVGAADIRFVCDELRRDPRFEFYCLVDSVAGVRLLAERVAAAQPGRPLNVLVEGGLPGGRCGVRDVGTAIEVAEAVRACGGHLALTGVEGFEGGVSSRRPSRREPDARRFLAFLVEIAETLDARDQFGGGAATNDGEVLLTAGGSAYFDLAAEELKRVRLSRPVQVVLRSGCYLTEDWGSYGNWLAEVHARTGSSPAGTRARHRGVGPGALGPRARPCHPVRRPA